MDASRAEEELVAPCIADFASDEILLAWLREVTVEAVVAKVSHGRERRDAGAGCLRGGGGCWVAGLWWCWAVWQLGWHPVEVRREGSSPYLRHGG